MAAQNTDKLRKVARKWVGQVGAGGVENGTVTTVPLASTANLLTETAIMITIDRVDANGVLTPDKEEGIIGVVSGDNLSSCIRGVEGTAQAHSAGAVVEVLWTAKNVNDIVDAILAEHSQSGAHTTDTISEKTEDAGVTVDGLKMKDGRIAGWDGWSELTALTRASDTTATLSGDWTDRLQKGDKLWWKSNGTSRYNYIIGISYSAPNTTITITAGYVSAANDSRFENGETITEPRYSKVENPQGFPGKFTWAPTYSCSGSMTYTDVQTGVKNFSMSGNKVFWDLDVQGTTGGTANKVIYATAPVQTPQMINAFATVRDAPSGYTSPGSCFITTDRLSFVKGDASNWSLGATRRIAGSGYYYI